jgi:hypothetical protein
LARDEAVREPLAALGDAEQQRRIDEYWRADLKSLDCDFPYDAEFATSDRAS